jgi:hypothetical protein
MPGFDRVTVTLPSDMVRDIDRRREGLLRSLRNPHPESAGLAEQGLAEWALGLPQSEDAGALVHPSAGKPVRWVPGEGWDDSPAPCPFMNTR